MLVLCRTLVPYAWKLPPNSLLARPSMGRFLTQLRAVQAAPCTPALHRRFVAAEEKGEPRFCLDAKQVTCFREAELSRCWAALRRLWAHCTVYTYREQQPQLQEQLHLRLCLECSASQSYFQQAALDEAAHISHKHRLVCV